MNSDNTQVVSDERMHLLDELQSVLKRQLDLAHQGQAASEKFDALTLRAAGLVQRLKALGALESDELRSRSRPLHEQYKALCLGLAAEKAGLSEELRRIRWSKKIIAVYHKTT